MLIRCEIKNSGPGPSEQIVGIKTKSGEEQVVLSTRSLIDGFLNVGDPLLKEGEMYLVELPRESASGRWRVWVPDSEITSSMIAAE